jgi:adhesin/invasin
MTFTAPPVATGATSLIVIDDAEDPADGSSPSTVTVTVRDQFGNPVAAGTPVCLTIASGGGTLSSGPWTTNASGQVTATITAPTTPGTTVINGKLGACGSPGENIGDVEIDFVPGPPNAGQSDIEVDEPEQNADGESESIVKVTVRDASGNPVGAGVAVCLTGTGDGTMGAGPWVTDANGQVTTTVTAPTTPGTATVTATLGTCDAPGGSIGAVDVDFVPGPPDAEQSTVEIEHESKPADGTSESTVTVTILDANGNPVPVGTAVCLAITDGGGTLGSGPWVTDANGQVTTTITAPTESGTTTINASLGTCGSSGESMGDVDIEFLPGDPDTTESEIVIDETEMPADGKTEGTVIITIRDSFGNAVAAGTPVCLALESGGGTLGSGPWVTDEFGQVRTTITAPSTPGTAVIGGTMGTCDAPGEAIGTVTVTFVTPVVTPATLASTGAGDLTLPLSVVALLALVGFALIGATLIGSALRRRTVR